MEQDVAVQAVPATLEVAIQASGNRPRPNSTAYAPLDLDQAAKQEILNSKSLTRMLERVMFQVRGEKGVREQGAGMRTGTQLQG